LLRTYHIEALIGRQPNSGQFRQFHPTQMHTRKSLSDTDLHGRTRIPPPGLRPDSYLSPVACHLSPFSDTDLRGIDTDLTEEMQRKTWVLDYTVVGLCGATGASLVLHG
jgi:hypothetical protein